MRDHLRLLINKPIEDNEIKPFKDLKMFNQACLDLDAIEELGSSEVTEKIRQMGGWPALISNWDDSEWQWENVMSMLRNYGYSVNYIFSFGIRTNPRNNTYRSAWVTIKDFCVYNYQSINYQPIILDLKIDRSNNFGLKL